MDTPPILNNYAFLILKRKHYTEITVFCIVFFVAYRYENLMFSNGKRYGTIIDCIRLFLVHAGRRKLDSRYHCENIRERRKCLKIRIFGQVIIIMKLGIVIYC